MFVLNLTFAEVAPDQTWRLPMIAKRSFADGVPNSGVRSQDSALSTGVQHSALGMATARHNAGSSPKHALFHGK
jgi:hypothetical protein